MQRHKIDAEFLGTLVLLETNIPLHVFQMKIDQGLGLEVIS